MTSRPERPDSAVVLAAGLGTRLRPATHEMAKPVLPVWNRPLLHHTLDALKTWGVKRVLLNLHHAPSTIVESVNTYNSSDLEISYSFEPDIAGTGGALRKADWFIGDTPFWMVNGDVIFDMDPEPLLQRLKGRKAIASVWLYAEDGPCTVVHKNGRVAAFRGGTPETGGATFSGIQLISPDIRQYLDDCSFFSIIDTYEKAIAAGRTIEAVQPKDSYWSDVGTWDSFRRTHVAIEQRASQNRPGARLYDRSNRGRLRTLKHAGVTCDGLCVVPQGTVAHSSAVIRDSILLQAIELKRGARVEHSIVCGSTAVQTSISGVNAPFHAEMEPLTRNALHELGWPDRPSRAQEISRPGSGRRFLRISCGPRTAVSVTYSRTREDNLRYATHTRFLSKHAVPVPALLLSNPRQNLMVIEDLGNHTLGDELSGKTEKQTLALYRRVLKTVHQLHQLGSLPASALPRLEPAFDRSLYRWEHGLFFDHAEGLTPALKRSVTRELETLVDSLMAAPTALIHRDLQSSNVLMRRGKAYFIDYQGMRKGAAAYDMASLLADPYVQLPENIYSHLIGDVTAAGIAHRTYHAAVVQRLLQAIGAFRRLDRIGHSTSMSQYIAPAVARMLDSLQHLDADFPDLRLLLNRQIGV